MRKYCLLISLLFLFWAPCRASFQLNPTDSILQDTLIQKSEPLSKKQKLIIAGLIAQQTASMYLEYKWWWQGDYHPFVMNNDGGYNNYSLGIDKVGHFYTSYMYSNALYELLKWGEFREERCLFYSTLLPFVWALSIEIGDGFSSYEFSPTDLLANSIGIGYAYAQHKVPYLRNFKFKFSYFPSSYYIQNNYKNWSLTADYNGHIYWLSTDVHGVLPKTAKGFWPKYLNLSLGYGVNNFAESFYYGINYPLQREFFIGLDYNLNAIPVKNKTLKTGLNIADYYHFPAPGIKKTGNGNWQFQALLLN
ncbi:MAG: hypothetical protein CFE21_11435 [Bacteroidetes bacterium B1(2017)]|nr:MAG: hypothetical protein CFE21_11435 [Bacteroidetes bacterium B1(2017)]